MKSMIRLLMCALALPCAASFCPAVAGTVQVTPVQAFGPLLRDGVGRQVWLTAIREADEGTGPSGLGDGNRDTRGDPSWTPLGAPASNLSAPNFTPPFPAYPSGHAGLGSAMFQTLRNIYGSDRLAFTGAHKPGQTRLIFGLSPR